MENITQTVTEPFHNMQRRIHLAIYGYRKSEFFPIYENGELSNRNDFIAYKAKKTAEHIGHFAARSAQATAHAAVYILEHAGQD